MRRVAKMKMLLASHVRLLQFGRMADRRLSARRDERLRAEPEKMQRNRGENRDLDDSRGKEERAGDPRPRTRNQCP